MNGSNYLSIDVGGSKTLLAIFTPSGKILAQHKMPTNPSYKEFLKEVQEVLSTQFKDYEYCRCCCAIPGSFNKKRGIATRFGNLKWHNVPIARDISKILGGVRVYVENDAALGGLSEANLILSKYKKVLYVTIGTGIGDVYIIDGKINSNLSESESGHMVLMHDGKLQKWESFASGHALLQKYGKKASEIEDPEIWAEFAFDIAEGLQPLIATLLPDAVIIGGGVGTHLHKFIEPLDKELKKLENTMVKAPPILQARRAEEAVIYGCYEYIKQNF
jgi:glucokinase